MPQTSKVAWAQLRVGLMAIVAIAILVMLVFLLTGRGGLFRKTDQLRTFVDDSASLKIGAPVRLNGIEVGSVEAVRLSGTNDPRRTVEVVMQVQRDFLSRIPTDSQASLNPEGVFGDKYVNITRGTAPQPVSPGGEIRSLDTKEFQEVVNQSYNVLTALNAITKRIDSITSQVEQGRGTVGKLLYDETLYNRIDAVVVQAQEVANAVNDSKGTIGKLIHDDRLYDQINTTVGRVDNVLASVEAGNGTLGMLLKDPSAYQNANKVLADAGKLVDNLNAGQGTLGKLLRDEALYRQANTTLGKVDGVLDRVNSGQGTLGQLLVNRALYDSLTGLTGDLGHFVRDVRADPRKYLRVKLAIF
jgi:phospholipid/cholesterol/gamma-HCH transport system substrate-binding protein